ncbi:alpha-ketoglutarate-dependent dioxygenase AlkB [Pseudolysobacter antarcticus]|uniref:Alpha-ketoglutarate-dependent dioxygenase AlkB n=1 Tax=Pseudolysobacter antarcticus TaxID=2511995 RepID=A0A411HQG9_9GAMM|nr:alpha-ketoglutarate-dependent dioxygenase AlkB [Pseudolysobacter antarcticus]QBB72744.1 alpha-ketoglutarate-dependent dioxygenase AlkB [Pseudolysobacter antarcticus]
MNDGADNVNDPNNWQIFSLPDADVQLLPNFLDVATAAKTFADLHAQICWEQHRVRLFGRELDSPRLSCWIGDDDAYYTYSRMQFEPRPWLPELANLRDRIALVCASKFNSVLCNLYRNGRDSMGLHSDDEPELGPAPVIASLSLGGVRRFRLRHKHDKSLGLTLDLPLGSLLLMRGATQKNYRHDLPKTAREVAARINLTFRRIIVAGETR